jgi:AAA domain/DnaB-like helicase N terminal domain
VPPSELQAKLAASRKKLEQSRNAVAVAPEPSPPALTRRPDKTVARTPTAKAGDKAPPHSDESEQAVLSTLLQYPEVCVPEAKRIITRAHFYNPVNAELFDIIVSLFDEGKSDALGMIAFTQLLRDRKRLDALGGPYYVTTLATAGIPAGALSWYAQTLREKFVLRELIALGSKLVRASYGAQDDEVGEIIDDFFQWMERVKYGAGGLNGSEPFTIAALQAFDAHHDANALAGRRWLVRGGTSLWAGGSGYGKSALEMQLAIYWACGRKCFGMGPSRPARSLIVQAENDLGDMAEQFQGVCAGIDATNDLNLEQSRQLIADNVIIHRIVGKTGVAFLTLLDALIQDTRCDIVWVDPLFAFAGCDLMNAKETGRFLREGLFPIAVRRNIALQVLHHVGKPVRDKDESVTTMSEIDYQYLGFGTSEIQNSFRAVNVIVPITGTGVFKLVLSKRGERAGAKDIDGNWTRTLYLEHSKEGICWLQTGEPEADVGRAQKFKVQDVLDEMSVTHSLKTGTLAKRLHEERNMSRATFFRLFDEGKKEGRIVQGDEGGWLREGTL